MKRLCLIALMLVAGGFAQQAPPQHWLLTFQLVPGLDLTTLTPEHKAVFLEHGKYLAALSAKGLVVVGGRTNETVDTLAVLIMTCDEATARAAIASDPATRAGYLKAAAHSFALLMPPQAPAVPANETTAH